MTQNSTTDSPRIFENGRLKPGVYKIQNLFAETYLDVLQHSKQVCCRPTRDVEDGKGLVRPYLPFGIHVSDTQKWEIKPLGVGYTVQRVSSSMRSGPLSAVVC